MQQVSGFLTRRALLVVTLAFGVGGVALTWLLVGQLTHDPQPAGIEATIDQSVEALPTETLLAEAAGTEPSAPQKATETAALIVYISGAVIAPDVYRLPIGVRVKDVIVAAGGFTADADQEAINLAAHVTDAQQIKVPRRGSNSAQTSAAAEQASPAGALINLNSASAADLDTLPGIGLAIAERIVTYRTTNGPFTSVDDLRQVKGIGAVLFEKIAPLVTVGT